jgi:D-alanyl-D-alanine carboxypeptidase/D-alanyl-D-alanine-endopeptidase (penicillin-binding protein 4)
VATVRAVGTNRTWHVRVDASAWTGPVTATGWTPTYLTEGDVSRLAALEVDEARLRPDDDERSSTPALQAGAAFVAALRQSGAHVAATVSAGPAPASGFGVASVSSAPAAALVRRMLTDSDNDLAEALGRAVAERSGASVDFEGEARAVTDRLRALGVPMAGVELHDASGLSRDDRVSAQALVTVLQLAADAHHPELRPVLEGLPVAGLTGTLADRFRRGPARTAAGDVRAKTGNLVGVNTLAGDVVDADGRLLFFAFLTARATSPQAAEPALDRLASRLRSYGCAQAPSRPAT